MGFSKNLIRGIWNRPLYKDDPGTRNPKLLSCLLAGHKYDPIWHFKNNSTTIIVEDKTCIKYNVPDGSYFICTRCQKRITKEEYLK